MTTTQIQVVYKQRPAEPKQEIELYRFQSAASAEKFLRSIVRNPDVERAIKL